MDGCVGGGESFVDAYATVLDFECSHSDLVDADTHDFVSDVVKTFFFTMLIEIVFVACYVVWVGLLGAMLVLDFVCGCLLVSVVHGLEMEASLR